MKLNLKINGLTHHALAKDETRERFVQEAVGREVKLRQMTYDGAPMVAAIANIQPSDIAHIGNVERMSLALALRALRGEGKVELKGKIVKAEPYMLTVEVEVERLAELLPEARSLRAWQYTGPMMDVSHDEQFVDFLVDDINARFEGDPVDADLLEHMLNSYIQATATDISRECLRERSAFADRLEAMANERLQALGARLREASQRLGGDHGMARVGGWMKHDVAASEEAQRMVLRTHCSMARAGVLVEAEQLPKGLWNLWRTDEKAFARALYNMSPSREDVRRVLSCLVWLDATADGAASDDGVRGVALMVETALEIDDEEVTRNMELVLARANDKAAGAYGIELRRLRRWQEEERVRREGPGRPRRKDFIDIMAESGQQEHLQALHTLLEGRKGKDAAFLLQAALLLGWLTERPTFESVEAEFGNVGAKSNFNKYIKMDMTTAEREVYSALLKE